MVRSSRAALPWAAAGGRHGWRLALKWISPYAIGGVASYWLIARLAGFAQ
jgi:hypothetical protein